MAQLLGNIVEGTIVKINENDIPIDFYIACQNYESDLNGEGRTLIVRKDDQTVTLWNNVSENNYLTSTINQWLNSSYKSVFDQSIANIIETTKFWYTMYGSGAGLSTMEASVFLLSLQELGISVSGAFEEGETLPIASTLKSVNYNGSPYNQWTRTRQNGGYVNSVWYVDSSGRAQASHVTGSYGVRPVFTLPSNAIVLDNGLIIAISTPTLTVSTTAVQTQSISLSWSSVSGATSYQLQRNTGSSWETIYTGPNTSYEDTAGNWGSVQYQVCALVDTIQGAYSDSKTVTIIQPSAVPTINSIPTVNLTESFTITWNSVANADSYILQRNIGSGWEEVYSGANLQYQDQALYSNMSYRVASIITDLYQSAWSPEYVVDINGQMIEMNIKNADGSYEAIYPKTLIGNIAGIEDQYYTKQESLQSNVATLIGLTNQAVPNDMFNILAHAGDLHVWKRTIDGNTDYPVSVNRNSYQEGDNAKPAGYTLGEIQNGQFALIGSNVGLFYQYGDVNVSDGGSLSIKSPVTLTIKPATNVDQLNVMRGKFVRASGSTALGDFPKNQVFYIPEDAVFEVYDTGSGYNGSRVNKRQVVTGYPSIPANTTIEYLGQLGNKAQVEVGSYVGTGTYGKSNPNTLTFGFEPKIIIIGMYRGGTYINFYFWGAVKMNGANNYAAENVVSTSDYTISWYHPSDVSGQLNKSGITYNYIAIG